MTESDTQTVIRAANRLASRMEKTIMKLSAELSSLADKVEAAGNAGHIVNYEKAVRRARKILREAAP